MLKLEKKYENVENSYKTFTVTFHKFFLFQMKVIIKVFFFVLVNKVSELPSTVNK